ncbi:MAG: glycosyltransferase family 2 protein [Elusimicrobia bacterium]|nr:glycosyltransferase family 2 protein [Elusimicrobiota bacterium]
MSRPVLSVVGPVHDEAASLPRFHERLVRSLSELGLPFEIIYVDDGSRDRSAEVLARLREADPRVKVLRFSRNFGHQVAITAGMDHASGQACVIMDTDGQDPPEIIGRLVEAWKAGGQVVYAVRAKREGEGLFKKATAALFYRLLRRITRVDIPPDAGDFRLLDERAVKVMRELRETHRFVRGLTSWVGFRQTRVEYVRKARLAGETHYPLVKMARFAVDGITSFSHAPLRWVTLCGIASFGLAALVGGWVLYVRFYNISAVRGWASLMAIVLFLGGIQLMSLGIMGEYMGRIFDEVKRRPLYVIDGADGFDEPPRASR